jgi:predicted PolB exonuclease-like 3'-5' exonuclease
MTATLAFDIETVPDVAGIRRVHDAPPGLDDAAVLDWFTQQRRAQSGSDFLAPVFQRIVAIACVLRDESTLRVWSLGDAADPEEELLRRFCDGIDRYVPQLVSWNGSGFDLPVIHHRCMIHGVCAPRYWDWGDDDKDFRYNNYLGRYHTRHLDMMDVLAMYQPRAYTGLDAMARLCGFPGKLGMSGASVQTAVHAGRIDDVRRYCETDVMNTYLLYLRFQQIRGTLAAGEYSKEVSLVRERLAATGAPHWQQFLAAWDMRTGPDRS